MSKRMTKPTKVKASNAGMRPMRKWLFGVSAMSHLRAEPMSKEQLDAVKDQLMSEDNAEIREKISSVYLEDPERGAEMIIAFASDKGLKLDATADEVVDHLEKLDDDLDIELTQKCWQM